MKPKISVLLQAIVLGLIAVAGCSLKVKNIKPVAPIDFKLLSSTAGLAEAAYLDDVTIRSRCTPAFTDVYIQTIASTNNKFFLATSTITRTQLISIAGTANIENVLLDADTTRSDIADLKIPLHRGFERAARVIYGDIKPRLIAGYHIEITGHSLGGAEALILAMMLNSAGVPVESVITFGQPMVTTPIGVESFKELPLTRVVNQYDVVPQLPLNPYRHIGPELVLFPGETYSVVEERPLDPTQLIAVWRTLQNHQTPAEMTHHYMVNYRANLDSKISSSRNIPYPG